MLMLFINRLEIWSPEKSAFVSSSAAANKPKPTATPKLSRFQEKPRGFEKASRKRTIPHWVTRTHLCVTMTVLVPGSYHPGLTEIMTTDRRIMMSADHL